MNENTQLNHEHLMQHYQKCTAKIEEFLQHSPDDDTISNHTKCLVANLLDETKRLLNIKYHHDQCISQLDLIDIHIAALRDCVLDLCKAKDFITKGVKQ